MLLFMSTLRTEELILNGGATISAGVGPRMTSLTRQFPAGFRQHKHLPHITYDACMIGGKVAEIQGDKLWEEDGADWKPRPTWHAKYAGFIRLVRLEDPPSPLRLRSGLRRGTQVAPIAGIAGVLAC